MDLGDKQLTTSLFEEFPIRRVWQDGEWWYCCMDCLAAITASANPRHYWSNIKAKLKEEGINEVYQLGVRSISLPDSVGHIRKLDCANVKIMLRLIQSIKSPRAEPFKQWLAQKGAEALQDDEEKTVRAAHRYQLHHFDAMLHEMVTFRGIVTPEQHEALTEANYMGLYEVPSRMALVLHRELPMSAFPIPGTDGSGPEAFMGPEELATNIFQRAQTAARVKARDSHGEQILQDAQDVGTEIRRTLQRLGRPMPENMPTYPMLRLPDWLPEDEMAALSQIDWEHPAEETNSEYGILYIEGEKTTGGKDSR